jgi:hypothetical protein
MSNPWAEPYNNLREQGGQKPKPQLSNIPTTSKKPSTIDDFSGYRNPATGADRQASAYSAYKAGGGDAAMGQGRGTRQDIINQGIKNINRSDGGSRAITPTASTASTTSTSTLQPKPERPTNTSGIARGSGPRKPTTPAATPAAPTKPATTPMQQFAAANPKLAAAAAERDRTRGTSATTNPLMAKTFGADYVSKMSAPKTPSPTTSSTAFSSSTPALGSSTPAMQSAGGASASKPVTNQTKTAFSNPSLLSQTTAAEKPEPKKAATPPSRMPLRNSHIITGYLVREGYISEKTDLPGNQEKIDANKNGKIDANDFKLLRAGKKVAKTAGDITKATLGSEPGNVGKMTKV